MAHKKHKRPPVAIQRVNKMIPRLEMAIALELYAPVSDDYPQGHPDYIDLAKLLRSTRPEDKQCTPYTLSKRIGLDYNKIVSAFKEMKRMEAVVAVAQRLPNVAVGIAIDAESKEITCAACEGVGHVVVVTKTDTTPEVTKTCIPCEGTGKVIQSGDPVARKQVLDMMNLAGQNAVPINAPNAQIVITGESLEDTLRGARRNETRRDQSSNSSIPMSSLQIESSPSNRPDRTGD